MTGFGRHLRLAAGPPADPADATDGQLLDRFLTGRDEAAFDLLVRRHGRMVLGACRRVLGHGPDAEDAFQVTFLVLARKGRALTGWASVGGWLYRAACLTAKKARTQAVRRHAREARAARPEAVEPTPMSDDTSALDAEVARLPARYRDVVALCELGGRTRKEAAAPAPDGLPRQSAGTGRPASTWWKCPSGRNPHLVPRDVPERGPLEHVLTGSRSGGPSRRRVPRRQIGVRVG